MGEIAKREEKRRGNGRRGSKNRSGKVVETMPEVVEMKGKG